MAILRGMCKFCSFWLRASPVSKNICIFRFKNFSNMATNLNSKLELCPITHIYFILKSLQNSLNSRKFLSAWAAPFFKISKNWFYKKGLVFAYILTCQDQNLVKNILFCRPIMLIYIFKMFREKFANLLVSKLGPVSNERYEILRSMVDWILNYTLVFFI